MFLLSSPHARCAYDGIPLHSPSPSVSCPYRRVQALYSHRISVEGNPTSPCQGSIPPLIEGNPRDAAGPVYSSHRFVPAKTEGKPNRASDGFVSPAEIDREGATPSKPGEGFVSSAEIAWAAKRMGMALHMDTIGPFFRVTALNLQSKEVLGAAQGFVKVWTGGRILHLDSIRMNPPSLRAKKPLFGMALLLGAAAICHGYERNCAKAELLAINDTEVYHHKLVRYYMRMGFRTVYDVTGESLQDIPHMLIWGGVGTRMDANIEELLLKWSPAFRKSGEFCTQPALENV